MTTYSLDKNIKPLGAHLRAKDLIEDMTRKGFTISGDKDQLRTATVGLCLWAYAYAIAETAASDAKWHDEAKKDMRTAYGHLKVYASLLHEVIGYDLAVDCDSMVVRLVFEKDNASFVISS